LLNAARGEPSADNGAGSSRVGGRVRTYSVPSLQSLASLDVAPPHFCCDAASVNIGSHFEYSTAACDNAALHRKAGMRRGVLD
jgi:hypothetical protein